MSSIIYVPSLFPTTTSRSAAATDFITRMIAADVAAGNNSGLETPVQNAMATLVDSLISAGAIGVNAQGIVTAANSTLKAVFGIPGGQTFASMNVPLVYISGASSQLFNFNASHFVRKTGLATDGSTTYIQTNIGSSNGAIVSNNHISGVYITNPGSSGQYMGAADTINLEPGGTTCQSTSTDSFTPSASNGFYAQARNNSANYLRYKDGVETTVTRASTTLTTNTFRIYQRQHGTTQPLNSGARCCIYVIGNYVQPSVLAPIFNTYMTSIANALP